MNATLPPPPETLLRTPPAAPPARARRRAGAVIGFAWLRGTLEATRFVRHAPVASWVSPGPVRDIAALGAAIAAARSALGGPRGSAFLLLEQTALRHRTEAAPLFSAKAARSYLAARLARLEADEGPLVWCAQPTATARQDTAFLLHLLPADFCGRLEAAFRDQGLVLSRIFPLAVPLALELGAKPGGPRLVAIETDGATTIAVTAGGRLAFARTLEASWTTEAGRVGMEVNRSLLYAKQQLGTEVGLVRLMGAEPAIAAVRARCGDGREIETGRLAVADWLQLVEVLPPRHPQNLLAFRRRREGRLGLVRAAVAAGCWILLAIAAFWAWNLARNAAAERRSFAALAARAPALRAERAMLQAEAAQAARDRALVRAAEAGRVAPVPARALAYVASVLPAEARLSEFNILRDPRSGAWTFRLAGTMAADEETARSLLDLLQEKMGRDPWRARFMEGSRGLVALPAVAGDAGPGLVAFNVGGTLLER